MANWIAGAVKHPGALTKAAKAHGVSKKEKKPIRNLTARIPAYQSTRSVRRKIPVR